MMRGGRLRVGLAQIHAPVDEPARILESHLRMLTRAGDEGIELVVFPELSLSGYQVEDPAGWSRRHLQPAIDALRAESGDVTSMVGAPRLLDGGRATNTVLLIDATGVVGYQDKLYPPDYGSYDEGRRFARGQRLVPVQLGGFNFAIVICEDAWHGSMPYLARLRGADVIVHPAASARAAIDRGFDSEDGWTTICRAEALHYATYVLFVNQSGEDRRSSFWGGTKVIAPAGRVLARADDDEQLLMVELERDAIRRGRELLPMMSFEDVGLVHREVSRALRARTAQPNSQPQP